jgi:hypothetical protein
LHGIARIACNAVQRGGMQARLGRCNVQRGASSCPADPATPCLTQVARWPDNDILGVTPHWVNSFDPVAPPWPYEGLTGSAIQCLAGPCKLPALFAASCVLAIRLVSNLYQSRSWVNVSPCRTLRRGMGQVGQVARCGPAGSHPPLCAADWQPKLPDHPRGLLTNLPSPPPSLCLLSHRAE